MNVNGVLANEFERALDYDLSLESYISYFLGKLYGNKFGNKSIHEDEAISIFRQYESDIKGKGRKGLYKNMKKRGYSAEELADMLEIGILESVVQVMLDLDKRDLKRMENNGQLEVIGTKNIFDYNSQIENQESIYSASSFFRLLDN